MASSSRDLPYGTVTFLFSDIEDSTGLAHRLDPATFRVLLEQHHRLLREAFSAHGGVERGTQGDSFLVIFRGAPSAVAAAVDGQRAIVGATWPEGASVRVRMGLHTGEGIAGGDDYVGLDVNRAARIASAAHGGQIVLSEATRILAGRSLPVGVSLVDAGEHRLKGLDLPERLSTVVIDGVPSDFPPLRSMRAPRSSLPSRSTSFLGRNGELATLDRALQDGRLITLVGPGGTGKTSLALELARMAADRFEDGAWFVPLETVTDPEAVASAVIAALGLADRSGRPPRDRLLENLAVRSLLLVLDNFEQVLPAAPLVSEILAAAPDCRVIVTSRAPLHLSGEQVHPIDPLRVPDAGAGSDAERLVSVASVQLLVERARSVRPSFALGPENAAAVAGICRLLDGLPLGLEIAAARMSTLGPATVLDLLSRRLALPGQELRDAPARQRTLSEAIRWSYELLDPPQRRIFAQCSVFVGGWRLEEGTSVCQDPVGMDVAGAILGLVDQSLVTTSERGDEVRFGMLETIGTFAAEQLARDGTDEDLRRRHALAYLDVAEAHAPNIGASANAIAIRRLRDEAGNLAQGMDWAIDAGEAEIAHRLGTALWRFWWVRGDIAYGRAAMDRILSMPGGDHVTPWRMRALEATGGLAYYASDHDATVAAYQAQLAMARALGDAQGEADALFDLLFTEDHSGRLDVGLRAVDAVAAAYRAVGDDRGEARCAWNRAVVYQINGQQDLAFAELSRVVVRLRELGDTAYELMAASNLGVASLQMGDVRRGIDEFMRTMTLMARHGDDPGAAVALPLFALAARRIGHDAAALTLHNAYLAMTRRYGVKMPLRLAQVVRILEFDAPWERASFELDDAAYDKALERGREMSMEELASFITAAFSGPPGGPPDA